MDQKFNPINLDCHDKFKNDTQCFDSKQCQKIRDRDENRILGKILFNCELY